MALSSWTLRAFSCRRTGAGLLRSGQRGALRALYPSALFLACSAIDTGFSQPPSRKFIPIKAPYRAAGTQKWLLGTPRLRHPSVRLAIRCARAISEHTGSRRSPAARAGLALRIERWCLPHGADASQQHRCGGFRAAAPVPRQRATPRNRGQLQSLTQREPR